MKSLRAILLLLLLLALASPGLAQQADGSTQRQQRLAELAKRYDAASWPKPASSVQGVDLGGLTPRLTGLALEGAPVVDPVRGEASLRFGSKGGPATIVATVRLLASPAEAREALLVTLGAAQRTLARSELGDVAFAGRVGETTALVVAARGNVLVSVRALDPDHASTDASTDGVLRVARALDDAVTASPVLGPGKAPPAPVVVDVRPVDGHAHAGQPARLEVVHDPMGPAPAHLRFECDGDASVVLRPDGAFELLAPAAGVVTVRVWAASAGLAPAKPVEVKVVVE